MVICLLLAKVAGGYFKFPLFPGRYAYSAHPRFFGVCCVCEREKERDRERETVCVCVVFCVVLCFSTFVREIHLPQHICADVQQLFAYAPTTHKMSIIYAN